MTKLALGAAVGFFLLAAAAVIYGAMVLAMVAVAVSLAANAVAAVLILGDRFLAHRRPQKAVR